MSYDLTDPLQVKRLLSDASHRIEKTGELGSTAVSAALRELRLAIEAGPIELSVYADREKRLRLRTVRRRPSESSSIAARFERFHEANPHVYDLIVKRLRSLRETGVERTSVKTVIENLRCSAVGTRRTDTCASFKVSNDFASRYARMVAEREPELGRMLEVRTIRSL